MLKKAMKKVFDSFYVFSKFSLSFILLLCVFFLIYLLYTNYQNEDEVSKLQIELENELRENINENSEFIKNISKEILETKTALTNIEKLIKENSNKESKVDLTPINESIELLNKNFNSLSYEISSIKNKNIEDQSNSNLELVNQSINEVVELIKIKYENNMDFDRELEYLETILENNNNPILEKLSILKRNKYKGHLFLEDQFNDEVNLYLKNIVNNNNSLFNEIFLPYINLSPTSENIISDERILILEETKLFIKNRNITKAYDSISKIENYNVFFKVSFNEMKNYKNFITEISKLNNV
ncbi:hypothetical protein OA435_01085 [Pelagibacteraceae bacterium]|nr:hypothetical protein [Pelagibacteraceae bacterium]